MNKTELLARNSKQTKNNVKFIKKDFEQFKKETNWRSYSGSCYKCKTLKIKQKTILELAPTKRSLTYLEATWLFKKDVLLLDEYLNENILGKFYKGNLL